MKNRLNININESFDLDKHEFNMKKIILINFSLFFNLTKQFNYSTQKKNMMSR